MTWSNTKAQNLSQSFHVPGIFDDPTVDQFYARVPRVAVDGHEVEWSILETGGEATAAWKTDDTYPSADFEQPADTNSTASMWTAMGNVKLPLRHEEAYSGLQDQVDLQIAWKKRAICHLVSDAMFNGGGSTEPNGLLDLMSSDQKEYAQANALTYDDVTEMLLKISANNGQAHYIVTHKEGLLAYLKVVKAAGLPLELMEVEGLCRPVPAHMGVPILRNDNVGTYTTGNNQMYAVVLGDRDGLCTYIPKEADADGFFVQQTTSYDAAEQFVRVAQSIAIALFNDAAAAAIYDFT